MFDVALGKIFVFLIFKSIFKGYERLNIKLFSTLAHVNEPTKPIMQIKHMVFKDSRL